jgi:hypothetical protein
MRFANNVFAFVSFLTACTPTPAPAVTPTGGFALSGPFSMGLPNRRLTPPGPGCPTGSFDMTAQTVAGTATITWATSARPPSFRPGFSRFQSRSPTASTPALSPGCSPIVRPPRAWPRSPSPST